MKKITSVLCVLAIVAVMLCFAACGGEKAQEDMTTIKDDMTSMLDEATTLGDEIADDLTENGNVTGETDENMIESFVDDMTDDTNDNPDNNSTGNAGNALTSDAQAAE